MKSRLQSTSEIWQNLLGYNSRRERVYEKWDGESVCFQINVRGVNTHSRVLLAQPKLREDIFNTSEYLEGMVIVRGVAKPTDIESFTNVLHEACTILDSPVPLSDLRSRGIRTVIAMVNSGELSRSSVPAELGIEFPPEEPVQPKVVETKLPQKRRWFWQK